MDEMTHTQPDGDPAGDPPEAGHQERLPFDLLPAVALPYDNEADEPIGFALTARARRTVAPHSVPALSVIAGAAQDDPNDTRQARARALRRAGSGCPDIARQLGVDELLVRAWVEDLPIGRHRRVASRADRAAAVLAAPAGAPNGCAGQGLAAAAEPVSGTQERFATMRRAAADEGRRRLALDAAFAVGVGLLAGIAMADRHAVTVRTSRPEVAGRLIAWICSHAGADPRDVRVVLRCGSAVAGDVARHGWSSALGLDIEQIAATRWREAPTADAVEGLVRISDAQLTARVAGWCDALLQPELDPADVAF